MNLDSHISPMGDQPRRLIVLGSTGSIGTNVLNVVRHLHERKLARFEIVGLATGSRVDDLAAQAAEFDVESCAIASNEHGDAFDGVAHVFTGDDAARELVEAIAQPGDMVVGAMVGAAGIPATLAAIERGCHIALANKETLVAAGDVVLPAVHRKKVALLPIDSEHSALFQCVVGAEDKRQIGRLVITASGGPFRTWDADTIREATVEQALNHPTWDMGRKVTIDSASMMNKALEILEAHWLFDLPGDQIEAIVHPQSIVHGFAEFVDGSVLAQMGPPDMRTPIQVALTWPDRFDGCSTRLDWTTLRQLDFEPVDRERFPAVGLAYDVLQSGGTAGAVFNAANEVAVDAFLHRRIQFGQIAETVAETLQQSDIQPVSSLDDVLEADRASRELAGRLLEHSLTVAQRE